MIDDCPPNANDELRAENERLKTELAMARETNRSLNRRCQLAERAASEKVTASTGSLGRGLANYAASIYARELTEAREENGRLKTELNLLKTLHAASLDLYRMHEVELFSDEFDRLEQALFAALNAPDALDDPPTGETTAASQGGWADAEDPAVKPESLEDREGRDAS